MIAVRDSALPARQRRPATAYEQGRELEQRLSTNFDMFTREVLYTDRVYYTLPDDHSQLLFGGESPRGERYPNLAVTWEPSDAEYAREVVTVDEDRLRLRFLNFESKPVTAVLLGGFVAQRWRAGVSSMGTEA
jgi:hypothetical protein